MKSTYIIAEIGNSHEGSVGLAKQFIKSAAECGEEHNYFSSGFRWMPPILHILKMKQEKSILKEHLLHWSNGKH